MRRRTEVEGTCTASFPTLALLASAQHSAIVKHAQEAGTSLVGLAKDGNSLGKHHHPNVQGYLQASFVHSKAKEFHIGKVRQGKCFLLLLDLVTRGGSLFDGNRALQR